MGCDEPRSAPADLLSGRNNDPPSSLVLVDYDDDGSDDGILTLPPSHLFSSGVLIENDEENGNDSDGLGGDIYAQLNSFEEKLGNELTDLEKFGVHAGTRISSSHIHHYFHHDFTCCCACCVRVVTQEGEGQWKIR